MMHSILSASEDAASPRAADVASHAKHKQLPGATMEETLYWHPAVRTSEDCCEGLLTVNDQRQSSLLLSLTLVARLPMAVSYLLNYTKWAVRKLS